jgi:hypothetical protein
VSGSRVAAAKRQQSSSSSGGDRGRRGWSTAVQTGAGGAGGCTTSNAASSQLSLCLQTVHDMVPIIALCHPLRLRLSGACSLSQRFWQPHWLAWGLGLGRAFPQAGPPRCTAAPLRRSRVPGGRRRSHQRLHPTCCSAALLLCLGCLCHVVCVGLACPWLPWSCEAEAHPPTW